MTEPLDIVYDIIDKKLPGRRITSWCWGLKRRWASWIKVRC